MKALAFILSFISLLLWWEAPYSIACIMGINGILLFKTYDKSFIWILTAVFSLIALSLSIWNWDLHVGLKIVEMYKGV